MQKDTINLDNGVQKMLWLVMLGEFDMSFNEESSFTRALNFVFPQEF